MLVSYNLIGNSNHHIEISTLNKKHKYFNIKNNINYSRIILI
jgi:hypothetical protein